MKSLSILAPFLFVGILLYQSCYLQNGKTSFSHTCSDLTHNTCDHSCACKGLECPSIEENLEYGLILNKDYSISIIDLDTDLVYKSTIDSLGYYINKLQE